MYNSTSKSFENINTKHELLKEDFEDITKRYEALFEKDI